MALALLSGCGAGGSGEGDLSDAGGTTDAVVTADVGAPDAGPDAAAPDAATPDATPPDATPPDPDCDPLDPGRCALPWPSSLYLEPDPERATGYTLAFGATSLPMNRAHVHVDPAPFRRLDGYGLGVQIVTLLPGLDTAGMPSEWDLGASLDPASPSLLFAVRDGRLERVPHWVELDASVERAADGGAAAGQALFLRPAVILEPATRYVVAFRDLADASGAPLPPSDAFAALRDADAGAVAAHPALASRAARFDEVFGLLEAADVAREDLVLAWDFVTASEQALHAPIDEALPLALGALDGTGAPLTFDHVEALARPEAAGGGPSDPYAAFVLSGRMRSPAVVRPRRNAPGWTLDRDERGALRLAEPHDVPIHVVVPHVVAEGRPAGVVVYGHGMLGASEEVVLDHLRLMGESLGYVLVAADLRGMSADDATAVLMTTFDLSHFVAVGDGLVQGIVQTHVLVRTARTGLQAALRAVDPPVTGDITIDPARVYWFGASQGGIFGATLLASSPDLERAVLAVPGINYALMLQRSKNFAPYFEQLRRSYPGEPDVAILIGAAQLLWDATDPVSWWRRLVTAPAAGGGARRALLLVAKGDEQVPVVTNEILARTDDRVALLAPWDAERAPWGVEPKPFPHAGTGAVLFDFGNPWPVDRGNRPPVGDLPDPHSRIAEVSAVIEMVDRFFRDGVIVDVCGGDGCRPD